MPESPRIFICYARVDNESPDPSKCWLDRLLRQLSPLERQGLLKIWSDEDTKLGTDWDQTIKETLNQALAAVLLVSQDFLGSKYINEVELPLLLKRHKEQGIVLLPVVLRRSDLDAPFFYTDEAGQQQTFALSRLQAPNWGYKPLNAMTEAEQDETLYKVYERLKEIVEKASVAPPQPEPQAPSGGQAKTKAPGYRPFQAPPLPQFFVERPEHLDKVKALMLPESQTPGTLVVSAIYGLGGIGKSVLASALAHHPEIQNRYCDGILWATLGQNPDLLPLLSDWIQALGDYNTKPTSLDSASSHLRTLLYDKRVLLVVDDVWNPNHADPFRVGGDNCCVLVTTRSAQLANVTRYDLDVMTESQSVQMLANAIHHPLSVEERHAAETLAKEVGYLPLALELTAAQVEEGVPWSQLLQDLRSEVADLTALDRVDADELDDDAKRRKHSLVACFNLSVKLLTKDQLALFAWLGVLPEDVSVTPGMVATLWNLPERQAARTLLKFKQKALLLSVSGLADGTPTYRMHDLMHDLAVQLLQAPVEPEGEKELPGLGLTKALAHGQLLERYRAKTQNNQWHTLPEDGYIHAHLTWHMGQAEQPEAVHDLLQETTAEGRNAWYEACDALGQPAQFVSDLGRAWELAEKSYAEDPTRSIVLQCHYGLIKTSLNSMAQNIPAELIATFVKNGFWSPAQGLAYAQQALEPRRRKEIIKALTPNLPESLLPKAVELARTIESERYRASAITALTIRLPELYEEALEIARETSDESIRQSIFICLGSRIPNELHGKAADIAREMLSGENRVFVLQRLAKKIPELYAEALALACEISRKVDRGSALWWLSIELPEELYEKAIEATHGIKDQDRVKVLTRLARKRPELYSEVLEEIRKLQNESEQARALRSLVKDCPQLYTEVLEVAGEIQDERSRSFALQELAQNLPENLYSEFLSEVKSIQEEQLRTETLISLNEKLPELYPEVLEVTRSIQDAYHRLGALTALTRYFPELYSESLEVARSILDEYHRARALAGLAKQFPGLYPEALEITKSISHEYHRSLALEALAEHLPETMYADALEITQSMRHEASRTLALEAFALKIPELIPEVFEIIRRLENKIYPNTSIFHELKQKFGELPAAHSEILSFFGYDSSLIRAKDLPEQLYPEALRQAQLLEDDLHQLYALGTMAEYLPELYSEILESTKALPKELEREQALKSISAKLPQDLYQKALEITQSISYERYRSDALESLAEKLPTELYPLALEITKSFQKTEWQAHALRALAANLPESLHAEALDVVRLIQHDDNLLTHLSLGEIITSLSRNLSEALYPEALEIARSMQNEEAKAFALASLAEKRPELTLEVIEITRSFQNWDDQWAVLSALIERNLASCRYGDLLALIKSIQSDSDKANVLSTLADDLPEALYAEALVVARSIENESYRAGALRALARGLPEALYAEALVVARPIQDGGYRAKALSALAVKMPDLYSEALAAVNSIESEFFRSWALTNLVKELPESWYLEALEVARSLQQESDRVQALIPLTEKLPELYPEVFELIGSLTHEPDRCRFLRALAPNLPEELYPQALELTKLIENSYDRKRVLDDLAENLPKKLYPEVLLMVQSIQSQGTSTKYLLEDLIYNLDQNDLDLSLWKLLLTTISCQWRKHYLNHLAQLAPAIVSLGGEAALRGVVESMRQVCGWWP
jgi:hypothetical protein